MELDNLNRILEKKIPLSDLLGFLKDVYFFFPDVSAMKAPEQKLKFIEDKEASLEGRVLVSKMELQQLLSRIFGYFQ